MLTSMSKKEAIEKMGCEKRECKHFMPEGVYSFCRAIFTEDMCYKEDIMKRDRIKEDIRQFYLLAKKYGFCYLGCKCKKCNK